MSAEECVRLSLEYAENREKLNKLYGEIDSGKFAKNLLGEYKKGMGNFNKLISKSNNSAFQQAHNKMRTKLISDPQTLDHRKKPAAGKKQKS